MSLHAAPRPSAPSANADRRSSAYDDDPMVRITGLSLDPDFPPSQQSNRASANQQAPRDSDPAPFDQKSSSSAKSGNNSASGQTRNKSERRPAGAEEGDDHQDANEGNQDGDQGDDEHAQHGGPQEHDGETITLRALVSSREAGVIIGKGGKNVAEVREKAGVRAGVSKVVQGVHERILTVSGALHNVSQVFMDLFSVSCCHFINPAEKHRDDVAIPNFVENLHILLLPGLRYCCPPPPRKPYQQHPSCSPGLDYHSLARLPPAHGLSMYTFYSNIFGMLLNSSLSPSNQVIGKAGSRIREIQEESGAKIVVSKELLPQSTERVIDIYGLADSMYVLISHCD